MEIKRKESLVCPLCGKEVNLTVSPVFGTFYIAKVGCSKCNIILTRMFQQTEETIVKDAVSELAELWDGMPGREREIIDVSMYDKEETYTNCTVQVLENTLTGDISVAWFRNPENEEEGEEDDEET